MPTQPIFAYEFTVPRDAVDENGHANNVAYVQWMQDVAVRHYESLGGIPITQALGLTWVVRSHFIEYLQPAFEGDRIEVRTWVANLRRVRSLRRYQFARQPGDQILARGETDWVLVEASTGRPVSVPREIAAVIPILQDEAAQK
jgi:acyl-CoA thioester hydrolase